MLGSVRGAPGNRGPYRDLLRLEVETAEEATSGGELGDEREDLHFLATKGTKERVHFEDPSNELSPGETSSRVQKADCSGEQIVILDPPHWLTLSAEAPGREDP